MSTADILFCLYLDAPAVLVEPVRAAVSSVAPRGFEERSLAAGVRFVLYAESAGEIEASRRSIQQTLALPAEASAALVWSEVASIDDWRHRWTQHLGVQRLTPRTRVIPVPDAAAVAGASSDPQRLRLLQRSAFGFGEHPTTRLIATRLEQLCVERPGMRVLDVGTGTGVLAILAALRGAEQVYGVDLESSSVEVARANARLNGVASRCRFDGESVQRVDEDFDLVLANIDAPVLLELGPAITRTVTLGGRLLLSGMLVERGTEVRAEYGKLGLTAVGAEVEDEWLLVELRRDPD